MKKIELAIILGLLISLASCYNFYGGRLEHLDTGRVTLLNDG